MDKIDEIVSRRCLDRYKHREGKDDYGQPRALFDLFDDGQKARLFSNTAEAMQGVPEEIIFLPHPYAFSHSPP